MPHPLALDSACLLLLAGFIAGIVNTLAGGGSLLTLPALMAAGLPPQLANGSNRFAVLVQSLVSAGSFRRQGLDAPQLSVKLLPVSLAGGLVGALLATRLDPHAFRFILGATLILIGLTSGLRAGDGRPRGQEAEGAAEASSATLPAPWSPVGVELGPKQLALLFAASVYGGFVQAGVGLLLIAVLSGGMGLPLPRANAVKVGLVAGFSALSLLTFAYAAQVALLPGAVLAVGAGAGALVGARWNFGLSPLLLKRLVMVVAILSGVRILLP